MGFDVPGGVGVLLAPAGSQQFFMGNNPVGVAQQKLEQTEFCGGESGGFAVDRDGTSVEVDRQP